MARRLSVRRSTEAAAAAVEGANADARPAAVEGGDSSPFAVTDEVVRQMAKSLAQFRQDLYDWMLRVFDIKTYELPAAMRKSDLTAPMAYQAGVWCRGSFHKLENASSWELAEPHFFVGTLAAEPPKQVEILGALLALATKFEILTPELSKGIFRQLVRAADLSIDVRRVPLAVSPDGRKIAAKLNTGSWHLPSGEVVSTDDMYVFE